MLSITRISTAISFVGNDYYCESGIQLVHKSSTEVTHSGMGNSVKVPVAVVPSLPHGSVYSYPPTQLTELR